MADESRKPEDVELNLTAMIDCVFLLLIFFMVTTVFTSSVGLKIELPKAEHWQKIGETKLSLSIGEEGGMELNGRVVSKSSLAGILMSAKRSSGAVTLIIKADVASRHEHTLDVMEIAKGVGIETISLAVEKPEDGNE